MFDRLDPEILKALHGVSTGTVGHFLSDGFLSCRIQPLFRPVTMVGQAVTVSSPPSDNSVFREAIEAASPGDVLVIDRGDDRRHAGWGGVLTLVAKRRGLAGVVIDGAATDWRQITEAGFPVFCRNLSALTTRRQGLPGTVGAPVACGGITVRPGDVILGDEDGVVAIPAERAAEVAREGSRKERWERRLIEAFEEGRSLQEARAIADAEHG